MFCQDCGVENNEQAKFCFACGTKLALSSASLNPVHANTPVTNTAEDAISDVPIARANAGFWYRVLATLLDGFLCQLASVIIIFPLALGLSAALAGSASWVEIEELSDGLGALIGLLIQWLWFTMFESSRWQATPGKKALRLIVTDEQGFRISFGRANARYWSKLLSVVTLGVGFLIVAFTRNKQGLHDLIASTLVVKARGSR